MEGLRKQIIDELKVKAVIQPADEVRQRIDFICNYLQATQQKSLILGISGGQDSMLAGRLCQLAVEQLRAQDYAAKFIALRLPYKKQSDAADVQIAVDFIQPDVEYTIDVATPTDAVEKIFNHSLGKGRCSDFIKGNIKARSRMVIQYAIAGHLEGLVVGTDHAAEAVTGFFTKYGDGGADIVPLSGLTKRQGLSLLHYLGAPKSIQNKVPTADLEDARPGLSDEVALGLTYHQIDDFLEGQSLESEIIEKVIRAWRVTRHKRHLPVAPTDEWWID